MTKTYTVITLCYPTEGWPIDRSDLHTVNQSDVRILKLSYDSYI
jgi:hypothetical protein